MRKTKQQQNKSANNRLLIRDWTERSLINVINRSRLSDTMQHSDTNLSGYFPTRLLYKQPVPYLHRFHLETHTHTHKNEAFAQPNEGERLLKKKNPIYIWSSESDSFSVCASAANRMVSRASNKSLWLQDLKQNKKQKNKVYDCFPSIYSDSCEARRKQRKEIEDTLCSSSWSLILRRYNQMPYKGLTIGHREENERHTCRAESSPLG